MSTDNFTAFIFVDGLWKRIEELKLSERFSSDFEVRDVSIVGLPASRLAPSNDEMFCFDVLYDCANHLIGFELRIFDDEIKKQFMADMDETSTVTGKVWPRVWISNSSQGDPRPDSTELFCDLHLCRTDDGTWIILVKADLLANRISV